jgi:hypothetical protein
MANKRDASRHFRPIRVLRVPPLTLIGVSGVTLPAYTTLQPLFAAFDPFASFAFKSLHPSIHPNPILLNFLISWINLAAHQ